MMRLKRRRFEMKKEIENKLNGSQVAVNSTTHFESSNFPLTFASLRLILVQTNSSISCTGFVEK